MMGRIGEPEVIVNAVVFVVQPEAGWVTGQMLTADGERICPITVRIGESGSLRAPRGLSASREPHIALFCPVISFG